jgi:hypothetical protein
MLLFDKWCQHDDLACSAWGQRKALLRRAHVRQRPKLYAKAPDFDPQACAMRFIDVLRSEGACEERTPRYVCGPPFAQRASKREQNRACREGDHRVYLPDHVAACVNDERL